MSVSWFRIHNKLNGDKKRREKLNKDSRINN